MELKACLLSNTTKSHMIIFNCFHFISLSVLVLHRIHSFLLIGFLGEFVCREGFRVWTILETVECWKGW